MVDYLRVNDCKALYLHLLPFRLATREALTDMDTDHDWACTYNNEVRDEALTILFQASGGGTGMRELVVNSARCVAACGDMIERPA
jgi:hypothetical protein